MIAALTFENALGDRLDGIRVRSGFDSRITTAPGPLWALFRMGPLTRTRPYHLAEIVPDDLGVVIRSQRMNFLLSDEHAGAIGGTYNTIWLLTYRWDLNPATPTNPIRRFILNVDPRNFTLRSRHVAPGDPLWRFPESAAPGPIAGDDSIIWYLSGTQGTDGKVKLNKIDAQNMEILLTKRMGEHGAGLISGNKNGFHVLTSVSPTPPYIPTRIRTFDASIGWIRNTALPPLSGHSGIWLGGGFERIYYTTGTTSRYYLHLLDQSVVVGGAYRVAQSYGPVRSHPSPASSVQFGGQ